MLFRKIVLINTIILLIYTCNKFLLLSICFFIFLQSKGWKRKTPEIICFMFRNSLVLVGFWICTEIYGISSELISLPDWINPSVLVFNPVHNILKLDSVLVQVRFATSNMKLAICYNKLVIQVAYRVTERLKTQDIRKLWNMREISNLGGDIT